MYLGMACALSATRCRGRASYPVSPVISLSPERQVPLQSCLSPCHPGACPFSPPLHRAACPATYIARLPFSLGYGYYALRIPSRVRCGVLGWKPHQKLEMLRKYSPIPPHIRSFQARRDIEMVFCVNGQNIFLDPKRFSTNGYGIHLVAAILHRAHQSHWWP